MLKYTFKRILVFIPMLIAISLLSFIISVNAPGDPVERLSKAAGTEGSAEQQSGASKKIKQELKKKTRIGLAYFLSQYWEYCKHGYFIQSTGQIPQSKPGSPNSPMRKLASSF